MSELSALGADPVLSVLLSEGHLIVNDYEITLSEIEGGHRLTVSREADEQHMDVLNGAEGEPGPGLYAFEISEDGDLILTTDGETATTWTINASGDLIAAVGGQTVNLGHVKGATGPTGPQGVQGIQGPPGEDAPQIDDTQASPEHPWSGAKVDEELQTALSGCVAKFQGASHVGEILKVDANGELNLSPFYSVVANDAGGNTFTI